MTTNTLEFEVSDVLTIADKDKRVWFKGFDVATNKNEIQKHVDPRRFWQPPENRAIENPSLATKIGQLEKPQFGDDFDNRPKVGGLKGNERNQKSINECTL